MKTSLDEFLKNKLPKPLDEFSMFSGKLAKVLMEQFAKDEVNRFLDFLLKEGYCDTDVYAESPTAIDQFYTKHKEQ